MGETTCQQMTSDLLRSTTANLKILMLTWEYPPNIVGGLSKHVYGLSKQLAKIGAEVHVVTADPGELPPFEMMNNVRVHRVTPLNKYDDRFQSWIGGLNLAMVLKAVRLASEIKFSILHAHDWLVGAAAIALKDSLKLPLLTTIHATEYGRNGGIYNEMQRFIHQKEQQLINCSDQIIVCSDHMREELTSIFGEVRKNIAVIPNGVDLEQEEFISKIILPKRADKNMIFSVGRVVREKGFETIIEAAELVKENHLNIFFVVAGKGPMLENYRLQVRKRELAEQIDFIGYIADEEKRSYLLESDITVFPSLYEPFGIVALESLIYAKPTIVSNIGGLKGMVRHMQTGLLMEPGNAESLLTQILFLLKNPEKAKKMGLQGRQIVKRLYGWNRVAVETKWVMEDSISGRRI